MIVRRDEGERDLDVEGFPDPLNPLDVRENLVDREPDQLAAEPVELIHPFLERIEFGRADRREIRRVAEQDEP